MREKKIYFLSIYYLEELCKNIANLLKKTAYLPKGQV